MLLPNAFLVHSFWLDYQLFALGIPYRMVKNSAAVWFSLLRSQLILVLTFEKWTFLFSQTNMNKLYWHQQCVLYNYCNSLSLFFSLSHRSFFNHILVKFSVRLNQIKMTNSCWVSNSGIKSNMILCVPLLKFGIQWTWH